ncbi:MAG: hypothetical protein Q7U04_14560, partial [Bacteriovorax sp.]|nr:hypothetical protein [Bacteriovorax sp.]
TEAIIYPEASDLDYPDMFGKQSEAPEVERDFKVDVKKAEMIHSKIESKKTVSREFHNEFENDSGLSLDLNTALKGEVVEKAETAFSLKKSKVKESSSQNVEEKKLLHERKIKISHQSPALNEIASRQPEDAPRTALPEHLKKRNDNYLMYVLVILVLIIFSLFFYYYRTILNKPLPV